MSEATGKTELWGHDGRRWWLVDGEEQAGFVIRWPVGVNGAADNVDVLTGRGNVSNSTALYQFYRRPNHPGLTASFSVTSLLLDANDRDLWKAWRRVRVKFAWPDGRGTADPVTITLAYSADAGATWVTAGSTSVAGNGSRVVSVNGAIDLPAVGSSSRCG